MKLTLINTISFSFHFQKIHLSQQQPGSQKQVKWPDSRPCPGHVWVSLPSGLLFRAAPQLQEPISLCGGAGCLEEVERLCTGTNLCLPCLPGLPYTSQLLQHWGELSHRTPSKDEGWVQGVFKHDAVCLALIVKCYAFWANMLSLYQSWYMFCLLLFTQPYTLIIIIR